MGRCAELLLAARRLAIPRVGFIAAWLRLARGLKQGEESGNRFVAVHWTGAADPKRKASYAGGGAGGEG